MQLFPLFQNFNSSYLVICPDKPLAQHSDLRGVPKSAYRDEFQKLIQILKLRNSNRGEYFKGCNVNLTI